MEKIPADWPRRAACQHLPRTAAIGGVQDACFGAGARADPRVRFAEDGDVGAAGGKCAFVFQGRW